jgi:hypothetical protein
MRRHQQSIRFERDELERLRRQARRLSRETGMRITLSDVVRRAVREYFEEREGES